MDFSKLSVQIIGQFVERFWCQEGCNNGGDAAENTEHRSKCPMKLLKVLSFLPMSENWILLASFSFCTLLFTTLRNNSAVPSAIS